jgi:hypothetical protein
MRGILRIVFYLFAQFNCHYLFFRLIYLNNYESLYNATIYTVLPYALLSYKALKEPDFGGAEGARPHALNRRRKD